MFERTSIVTSLVAILAISSTLAAATAPPTEQGPGRRPSVTLEEDGTIEIELGRSRLVRTAFPVARVSVTQPTIADVQVLSPNQVLVMGNSIGLTDLLIWDRDDNVWQRDIEVKVNLEALNDDLRKLFPDSDLRVVQSRNVLLVNGALRRADDVLILRQFLQAHDLSHVDMTRVAGVHQVLIEVKVAEVSRNAVRALTVNAFTTSNSFFGGLTTGSAGGGAFNPINIGVPEGAPATSNLPFSFNSATAVNPLATLFMGFPRADIQLFIQALAEDQMLRVLAEPNLVAMSGEEASFLAGGEYPIPVVQGGTGGGTSISVEYREFGIRLTFRPEVLGDNRIRLVVAPEVSDVSEVGAVEIQGFRIPAVITRRAETTLELKSGQSFAMAGLMSQRSDARTSKIPVLGDLPILGPLFRSVRYSRGETELVVLVTASLVEPLSLATTPPLPGDLHNPPSDWELFGKGWIEGEAPPAVGPADQAALSRLGLTELRGPGAWISHGTPAATPRPASTSGKGGAANGRGDA